VSGSGCVAAVLRVVAELAVLDVVHEVSGSRVAVVAVLPAPSSRWPGRHRCRPSGFTTHAVTAGVWPSSVVTARPLTSSQAPRAEPSNELSFGEVCLIIGRVERRARERERCRPPRRDVGHRPKSGTIFGCTLVSDGATPNRGAILQRYRSGWLREVVLWSQVIPVEMVPSEAEALDRLYWRLRCPKGWRGQAGSCSWTIA
jgi:hypothetical protein